MIILYPYKIICKFQDKFDTGVKRKAGFIVLYTIPHPWEIWTLYYERTFVFHQFALFPDTIFEQQFRISLN